MVVDLNKKLKEFGIKRALSVDNVLNAEHDMLDFKGQWLAAFGKPEIGSNWLTWGLSGSGKTRLLLELAKYLTTFGKVLINPLETGNNGAFQMAFAAVNFKEVSKRISVADKEPMWMIEKRLDMRKSADIIIVDSLPYTRWKSEQYYEFCDKYSDRMIIFNTHAKGKEPKGKLSEDARYHADVKVRIEGYKAFPMSRYGGGEPIVIYEKGAREYWNLDY